MQIPVFSHVYVNVDKAICHFPYQKVASEPAKSRPSPTASYRDNYPLWLKMITSQCHSKYQTNYRHYREGSMLCWAYSQVRCWFKEGSDVLTLLLDVTLSPLHWAHPSYSEAAELSMKPRHYRPHGRPWAIADFTRSYLSVVNWCFDSLVTQQWRLAASLQMSSFVGADYWFDSKRE